MATPLCRAYDFDPEREAQAFQQAAPMAKREESAPKPPQRVSYLRCTRGDSHRDALEHACITRARFS